MLPFLADKEGAIAQPSEPEAKDYGALDAVAQDMLSAFESKDPSLLKQALEALCEYVKAEDLEQDQLLTNKD